MRVVLLYNPRSGRGRPSPHINNLCAGLAAAGIEVEPIAVDSALTTTGLARAASNAAALVIAGGDGSVHHALPAALEADVPVYQYPLGTENLFAREFNHRPSVDVLVAALHRARITHADVAVCNQRAFVLMASVGFDAHVVERVAVRRNGGVRRADYVRHALAELGALRLPPLSVAVDGRPLADNEPGLVIVANSAHYAARLNPCAHARIDDGRLDVLFLPYRSVSQLAGWMTSIALGMHNHSQEARSCGGAAVTIRSPDAFVPHQLDGESIPGDHSPLALDMVIQPRRLRVVHVG